MGKGIILKSSELDTYTGLRVYEAPSNEICGGLQSYDTSLFVCDNSKVDYSYLNCVILIFEYYLVTENRSILTPFGVTIYKAIDGRDLPKAIYIDGIVDLYFNIRMINDTQWEAYVSANSFHRAINIYNPELRVFYYNH